MPDTPDSLPPVAPVKIGVPIFYITNVGAYLAGNDFSIVFSRIVPATVPNTPEGMAVAIAEPTVAIQLSPQTMKDLHLAVKAQLETYEKHFGEVKSSFTHPPET